MGRPTLAVLAIAVASMMPFASSAAGATSTPDSSIYYQLADDGLIQRVALPLREQRTPSLSAANPGGWTIAHALADTDTVYSWFAHGFDVAAGGPCNPRGWTGQERCGLVFAHVDNKHLKNDGFVNMGTKALWFGTDLATNPAEVAGWYFPEGFGSAWSQRLTFAHVLRTETIDWSSKARPVWPSALYWPD
jgi:hypothetical protein